MLLETSLFLKMQCDSLPAGGVVSGRTSGFPGNGCDSLPAGGAVRAVEQAVSPVTAVILCQQEAL